ncbi:hypothetical protein [Phytohabitans rumicis]|uniref:Runt domain-containing protein n=1 Tax=Phytohabitans rumicis TaxID=1076125 RepID=A0A6V8L9U7_9ACTN|nr:hypothetical protein [Phytohabitans rumicis]GFJ94002.1 hypothetical protein Prum_076440 [Phytohabitans rumicis]
MVDPQFTVMIVGNDDHTVEELEEATRQLRDELAEVDDVELAGVPGDPPEDGTRGTLTELAAVIMVTYYSVKTVVGGGRELKHLERRVRTVVMPHLAGILREWTQRHKDKRAIIKRPDGTEFDLTNLSEEEIRSILGHGGEQRRTKNG